jgi:putative hemolysin
MNIRSLFVSLVLVLMVCGLVACQPEELSTPTAIPPVPTLAIPPTTVPPTVEPPQSAPSAESPLPTPTATPATSATDETSPVTDTVESTSTTSVSVANPAAKYCIDQGGVSTIEQLGNGNRFGLCTFEDNRQCEEWALFRDECPVGGVRITGYVTEAGRYCAITGGTYEATETDASGEEQGTCTFADDTTCDVWEYFDGECVSS